MERVREVGKLVFTGVCVRNLNGSVQYVNRDGATIAPLPIFKSVVQFRILGELFTYPDLEVSVGDLAQRIDHPRPTVSHEVARLVRAGLLVRRRDGNKALLRAAMTTPVSGDLRSLLAKTYGPQASLRAAFDGQAVTRVAIFGSYAARWNGEPGPPPNDIDVVVVGDLDYQILWDITARVSRELGIEVNAILRTPDDWMDDSTPFGLAVKHGHLLDIVGGHVRA